MLFRRTIRGVLLALALTAGTAGLCASAPAADQLSPNLHIVPKGKSLKHKKTGGFTAVLKASALSLGKSLVKQVRYALAQKHPRQNQFSRSFPFERGQKKLIQGKPNRSPAGGIPLAKNAQPMPLLEQRPEVESPLRIVSHLLSVDGYFRGLTDPVVVSERCWEIFCASHYKQGRFFTTWATCPVASCERTTWLEFARSPVDRVVKPHQDGQGWADGHSGSLTESREVLINNSLRACQTASGIGSVTSVEFSLSAKHFPIDPVKGTTLLAHGAVGARIALRGNRSRNHRA